MKLSPAGDDSILTSQNEASGNDPREVAPHSGAMCTSVNQHERNLHECPSVPIHFLHIRKTGGTAIAEALRPVAEQYGLVLHDHSVRLCDIPRDHLVIFFVRHPITRFVSGFISRMRRGLPRHHYEWNPAETEAFRHFQSPNDLAEALSATTPERATQAQEAMHSIKHVNSTYADWFSGAQELDDRSNSTVVGLQETLSQDFEHLKRWLHLPDNISLPSDATLAHRTPPQFDRTLSPLAERNLASWYASDIRFYEHCVQLHGEQDFD